MAFVQERKSKGKTYLYLDRSVRVGKKVLKVSRYVGRKGEVTKSEIREKMKEFELVLNERIVSALVDQAKRKYS